MYRNSGRENGFSLSELLVVLALLGIAIAISIPFVNEQLRIAQIRAFADEFALHLRAARMVSVTQHRRIKFEVFADPANWCGYRFDDPPDAPYIKEFKAPDPVKIASGSDPLIRFKQNGSVDTASSIVLEARVSGALERWTATVNQTGMATLVHERVN